MLSHFCFDDPFLPARVLSNSEASLSATTNGSFTTEPWTQRKIKISLDVHVQQNADSGSFKCE